MDAYEHLHEWFTPERLAIINARALGRLATGDASLFYYFLGNYSGVTLRRNGLWPYYPWLRLLGYVPPGAPPLDAPVGQVKRWLHRIGQPGAVVAPPARPQELREWFTPERKQLTSGQAIDAHAQRPQGTLTRYLAGQKFMTLARSGLHLYYPTLQLLGYVPPAVAPSGVPATDVAT